VILWVVFLFGLHQYLIGVSPLAQLSWELLRNHPAWTLKQLSSVLC
jgi:hypothetical protein